MLSLAFIVYFKIYFLLMSIYNILLELKQNRWHLLKKNILLGNNPNKSFRNSLCRKWQVLAHFVDYYVKTLQ